MLQRTNDVSLEAGVIEDELIVADKKLGKSIQEALNINCKTGEKANELLRCIRFQMESLISEVSGNKDFYNLM